MLEFGKVINEYAYLVSMYLWSVFGLAALAVAAVVTAKIRQWRWRVVLCVVVVTVGAAILAWGGFVWLEAFGKVSCWVIFGGMVLLFVFGFITIAPIALLLIGTESIILGMGYLAPPPLEVMTEPSLIIVGVLLLLTGAFAMIFKRAFPPPYSAYSG